MLLLRLYLAPIFIQVGLNKLNHLEHTAVWFGESLGMPFPYLMAVLAGSAEFFGGILLLIGLMTRLASIPLLVTMFIAAWTVHWENGWPAIADSSSWLADGTILTNERVMSAGEKLSRVREVLAEHTHYDWITSSGNIGIINNGIEFAATYIVMLLCLIFYGGGRYTSIDYWLRKNIEKRLALD